MSGRGSFRAFEHEGWQKAASAYDGSFGNLTLQSVGPLLDAVGAATGMRLLDVASGPGYAAAAAARRGCTVTGIDFSSVMVETARSLHPDLEFREGDACHLELTDGSFDAVVMNFGMLHLENPERAASEAWRVLRPGGRYAFTVWDVPERAVGFQIMLEAIKEHGRLDVPLPPGPPFFRFSDPEESRRFLEAAGFLGVYSQQIPQVWRLRAPDDLFATFLNAAVRTAALLRGQTAEALNLIRETAAARVQSFARHGVIDLPMPSILTHAVRPK